MAQSGSAFGAFLVAAALVVAIMPDDPAPSGYQAAPETQSTNRAEDANPSDDTGPVDAPAPAQANSPAPSRQTVSSGYGYVSLQRAPDSHFYADAEVNGTTVHFLLDTGATGVVLTAADAQRVGISGGEYTVAASTAGGVVQLMPAVVDRIALGPLAAHEVPVLVAKDQLPISLLGQSYLSRIGNVSISGDTMVLR